MKSRAALLSAAGVVLVAAFAALAAPRVIVKKSPTVADRRPGDVRRIQMAVEDDGVVHAVLEVWTDSDWDLEYWSSIPALTPKARVVTNDLIEQSQTTMTGGFGWLGMAWVEVDKKTRRQTLKATMKKYRDRDWVKPKTVLLDSETPITITHAGTLRGRAPHVFYEVGAKRYTWNGLTGTHEVPAGLGRSQDPPPPPGVPADAEAHASFRDGLWTAFLRRVPGRAIFRQAHVRYSGKPGAWRRGGIVPVVALVEK